MLPSATRRPWAQGDEQMQMSRKMLTAALALASAIACGGSSGNQARLTVLLKDAPANFKAAVVTITEVNLQGTNGKTVLSSTKTTVDLLTLANDVKTLLKDVVIPPGTYSELRLVLSGGYVAVDNGSGGTDIFVSSPTYEGLPAGTTPTGTLKMPSMGQSGLKVDFAGSELTLAVGSKVLLIDFDVAQSFGHEAGASGSWVMHPVIKGAELTVSGNVNVTLALDASLKLPVVDLGGGAPPHQVTLADFSATLTDANANVIKEPLVADTTGKYGASFLYLMPGTGYTLTFSAPGITALTTAPVTPAAVTVTAGQATNLAFTLTATTPPGGP
jgi:hypothetical protein